MSADRSHAFCFFYILVALSPLAILIAVMVHFHVKKKEREANSLWIVKRKDLAFSEPPTVIGHGSFGYVLQAEYRGSKVAIKRALPPSSKKGGSGSGSADTIQFGSPATRLGSRDGSMPLKVSFDLESGDGSGATDQEQDQEQSPHAEQKSARRRTRSSQSMMMTKGGSRKTKQLIMEEMRVLSTLRHPNITTLMGTFYWYL
mmetsp:Transcript_28581/g.69258  ORF Transcript_28581/g.69258 Transcript_28581/m.69258 type:complete len:202 (+) Transcript_28581:175-780(+)